MLHNLSNLQAPLNIWCEYVVLQGVRFKFPHKQHMHWPIMATFGQSCLSLFPATTNLSNYDSDQKLNPVI